MYIFRFCVYVEGGAFLLYVRPPLVDRRFSMSIQTSTGAYSCTPASIQGFITAKIKLLQNKPTLKREYRPPCCIYSLGTKSPHEIISIANFLANNNQDYHEKHNPHQPENPLNAKKKSPSSPILSAIFNPNRPSCY